MPLFQVFAYAYIANSCEHNSYSFQWMILKPIRIVTHEELLCLKTVSFIRPFLTELCPFFKYLLMYIVQIRAYNSPIGSALVNMILQFIS